MKPEDIAERQYQQDRARKEQEMEEFGDSLRAALDTMKRDEQDEVFKPYEDPSRFLEESGLIWKRDWDALLIGFAFGILTALAWRGL